MADLIKFYSQVACQDEREWPLFIYTVLATVGFCVILVLLQKMMKSKK